MKILVTGGTGFLGKHVIRDLKNEGHELFCLTRKKSKNSDFNWISWEDLNNLKTEKIDYIVHCAGVINSTEEQMYEGNISITQKLVDFNKSKDSESAFIYISTVSAINKLGKYGELKRKCEEIVMTQSKWMILRPSLIFGEGDDKNVNDLIKWVSYSPIIPVFGGEEIKLQPLYVKDLSKGISKIISGSGEWGKRYTFGGPVQISMVNMLKIIQRQKKRFNILVPIPIPLLRFLINCAHKIFPFLKLPVQQINGLHKHEMWDTSDITKDLSLKLTSFEDAVKDMNL